MSKVPKTIRQILEEVRNDKQHSKEEIISFLEEIICLYEDYDGLAECLEYIVLELKKENKKYKEYLPIVEIFSKLCAKSDLMLQEEQNELKKIRIAFAEAQQRYLETDDDEEEIEKIGELAYYLNEPVVHVVAEMLLNQMRGNKSECNIADRVIGQQNIGFLIEQLAGKNNTFILISDKDENINYDMLSNMIFRLGHKVILMIQDDSLIGLEECCYWDSREEYEDLLMVPYSNPILYYLIKHYCIRYSDENLVCLLGNGYMLDFLNLQTEVECVTERLTSMRVPVLEEKLSYGWMGDYLSYISHIYKCDAYQEVKADLKYRFSIVIPTRNSVNTLRYTLQTCMTQRWNGEYEIVISDNSTEDDNSVFKLCEELNDERIHYYKAPRALPIGRNFEYAYLKTRGEFIIPIGADDGLLPWTLEVLDEILKRNTDEIFTWERGQYQWPDYGLGISDMLQFPCGYQKGNYGIYYIKSKEYFEALYSQPGYMYSLPLLYINSGFRRSYINTLLKKTGYFLDGVCQDINMGIVNIAINKEIARINYPLTIAGMTRSSTGQQSARFLDTIEKVNKRGKMWREEVYCYIGAWARSKIERLVPKQMSDVSVFYNCLMRTVAKKILPLEFVEKNFDMKKIFLNLYYCMHKEEYVFEQQLKELDFAAFCNGEEFQRWFKSGLNLLAMQKEEYNKEDEEIEEKTYSSTVLNNGLVIIDASRYGANNIYHAVILAEKVSEY